jgi:hypothetical protein
MIAKQIIFFSLIVITVGIILWRRGSRILNKGMRSEATIIKNVYQPDGEGGGVYYPVVEFLTKKNEKVTKKLSFGVHPARPIGKKLGVVYDPDKPLDFVTSPGLYLEVVPRLLVAIGITGLIISILDLFEVISAIPENWPSLYSD